MASAGARLLLVCACLLAAAALGSRDPGAPAGSRASQKPRLKKEPPAGAGESRARLDTGTPEPTTPPARNLNSQDTWLLFLRHSDEEDRRSQDRRSKPGLPRPREPCGMQGPAGTEDPLEGRQRWQQLVKAAAERLRENAEGRPDSDDEEEAAGDPSVVALLTQALNRGSRARIVEAAFHCRLRQNVSVERRALRELSDYYLPQAEGAFYRGLGLNLTSGQYTVSIAGFYALAATLHVEQRRPDLPRPRNHLRLLICIQSRCQRNTSLETVVSRPPGTEFFTISVSGVLYLKRKQHTSVFLDNASSSPVTVRSGSHFSAVFLGV